MLAQNKITKLKEGGELRHSNLRLRAEESN